MADDAIERFAGKALPTIWGESGDLPGYFKGFGNAADAEARLDKDATLAGYADSAKVRAIVEKFGIDTWTAAADDDRRLASIGYSANIERFFAESGVSHESRLAQKWETWSRQGTELSIFVSLVSFGFDQVRIFEEWEGTLGDPVAEYSYKFVVILGPSFIGPINWVPVPLGSDGLTWVLGVTPLGLTYPPDHSMVPYQVSAIKAQIRKWKFAPSVPLWIVAVFGDAHLLGVDWTLGASALNGSGGYENAAIPIPYQAPNQLGIGALGEDLHLSAWTYVPPPS